MAARSASIVWSTRLAWAIASSSGGAGSTRGQRPSSSMSPSSSWFRSFPVGPGRLHAPLSRGRVTISPLIRTSPSGSRFETTSAGWDRRSRSACPGLRRRSCSWHRPSAAAGAPAPGEQGEALHSSASRSVRKKPGVDFGLGRRVDLELALSRAPTWRPARRRCQSLVADGRHHPGPTRSGSRTVGDVPRSRIQANWVASEASVPSTP